MATQGTPISNYSNIWFVLTASQLSANPKLDFAVVTYHGHIHRLWMWSCCCRWTSLPCSLAFRYRTVKALIQINVGDVCLFGCVGKWNISLAEWNFPVINRKDHLPLKVVKTVSCTVVAQGLPGRKTTCRRKIKLPRIQWLPFDHRWNEVHIKH